MSLSYNGTGIYGINFNGVSLTQLNFNGVPVWYALTACTVSGTTKVGYTLSAKTTPSEVQTLCTYQWYRGNIAIENATNDTYKLTESDRGYQIKCVAKIGSASAASNFTSTILQDVTSLSLSGVLEEDYTLTASITPSYAIGTYQWYRDDSAISGATNSSYTLTHDDASYYIKCVFIANGNWVGTLSDTTSEKIVGWYYNSGRIASLSTSSNKDWFETSYYNFTTPIVPQKVYCYFKYDYWAKDDGAKDTSGGGGMSFECASGKGSGNCPQGISIGQGVFGRPESGTASATTTMNSTAIAWIKAQGGITKCRFYAGGGSTHGTQSCGGYIQGYWERK